MPSPPYGPSDRPSRPPGPPSGVGPYHLLKRLGAGGMGEVFLGLDRRPAPGGGPARAAAVKTIRQDVAADTDFRDRFRREIAAARAVDSRYTARLLDGDADGPTPWLATEYVPGPTLDAAVRAGGPLTERAVRDLGLDLVRALRAIHHAQVLHRDLKPANVLLGAAHAKVIDFGIARAFGAGTMTATGVMIGSPGFMSPEHIAGSRHVVAASDVFCLASLLCYAATGAGIFGDGPVAAVLYRIAQADADLTSVPQWLRAVLDGCLHPDPSARPDTTELERRFTAPGPHRAGPRAPWPDPVRALVADRERDLARLIAGAPPPVPVAPPVPTMPGAPPLHSAPTVAGPRRPPEPPVPPAAGARRRVHRKPVLFGATAVALALLAFLGVRELGGGADGDRDREPGGTGGTDTVAVDELGGPGRDGVFDATTALRPANWSQWSAKLAGKPVDCALTPRILVCRLVDGGLQALDPANGEEMWRAPRDDPEEEPFTSARGTIVVPGSATNPVVDGDVVLSSEAGRLRARSVTDGTVRWSKPQSAYGGWEGQILAAEGRVFVTNPENDGTVTAAAYDTAAGKRLWTRTIAAQAVAEAQRSRFTVQAYGGGLVYLLTEGGLSARDPRTGEEVAASDIPAAQCQGARLTGGEVFCPGAGDGLITLDARTLDRVDDPDEPRYPGAGHGREALGAISGPGALTTDAAAERVVLRTQSGQAREVGPVARTPGGLPGPVSTPAFVGRTAVYADNAALHVLPPGGGAPARVPVEGAPGIRDGGGTAEIADAVWEPKLLSLGGVLFVAYHDGTVRSLRLP